MTESDKAVMQQALDALERVDCVDGDCDILSLSLCEAVEESIAALREAIAQPEHQAEQELIDYGDARVQADRAARQADQGPCGWMQNIDTAMQEPLFGTLRGIMGTESIGQDIALLQTIRHYRAKTTWPAAEHNLCPRCGKRLGGTDDIHTCTALVDPKETK